MTSAPRMGDGAFRVPPGWPPPPPPPPALPVPELSDRTRLVVELNQRTRADLAWLTEMEELNKTTVVNRALQAYRHLIDVQSSGGVVKLDRGDGIIETIRFV